MWHANLEHDHDYVKLVEHYVALWNKEIYREKRLIDSKITDNCGGSYSLAATFKSTHMKILT